MSLQGFRFVCRGTKYTWCHPLEMEPGDVDLTDLDDEQFEQFVRAQNNLSRARHES